MLMYNMQPNNAHKTIIRRYEYQVLEYTSIRRRSPHLEGITASPRSSGAIDHIFCSRCHYYWRTACIGAAGAAGAALKRACWVLWLGRQTGRRRNHYHHARSSDVSHCPVCRAHPAQAEKTTPIITPRLVREGCDP